MYMPKYRRKRGNYLKKLTFKNARNIKRIKQMIEYKYVDAYANNVNINTVSIVIPLNNVAQGTGTGTVAGAGTSGRIGNEVTNRRILIRGYFKNNHGNPSLAVIRLILIRKRDPNGALPATAAILYNDQLAGTTVLSNINMDHKEDFRILLDTSFAMDASDNQIIPFKILKKLRFNTRYNAAGGTSAQLETEGLYLVLLSNIGGTDNCPQVSYEYRWSYCDL